MGFNKNLIEIAVGSVSNRGKLIPYSELTKYINKEKELYRSMFCIEDHAMEGFTSIKNYNGMYKLKHIIFDIDKGSNAGAFTMDRTWQFVKTLIGMDVKKDHIQVWFSGRGFHVEIPDYFGFDPSEDLPQTVKLTLHKEFGNEIDNIYDKGRIIRVNYTLNKKSGLYKTPLSWNEIENYSYDAITEISAQFIRKDFTPSILPEIEPVWKARIQYSQSKTESAAGEQISLEVKEDTNGYVPHVVCVQKMAQVVNSRKGNRHDILLRMGNAWRRAGISLEGTKALSKLALPSLKAKERNDIVESVFSWDHNGYSCNDPIMEEFCDSRCRYFQSKNFGVQSLSTDMLAQKLKDFVFRDHEYSFDLGNMYKLGYSYKINPGELVVVIGDVKLGKTAWVQNIVVNTKHLKTLFLSLEVSAQLIFRRFIQIANSIDKQSVYDAVREDGDKKDSMMVPIRHISVITKCDLDSLKDEILSQQAKLIVIDTLDGLEVKGMSDPFRKQERIAMSLKQMAQDLNVIILGINHISKSASYNLQNSPMLTVHSAKGNSALEQKADKMIGIEGQMDSVERRIRSLASRDESGFTLAFKFNRETMEFQQEVL